MMESERDTPAAFSQKLEEPRESTGLRGRNRQWKWALAVSSRHSCISLSNSSTRPRRDSDAITHLNAVSWCASSWLSCLLWEGCVTSDSIGEGPGLSQTSLSHTHTKATDGSHYLHARVPVTDGTLINVLSGRVWQSCCIYTDVQPPYILGLWI